ncbi:MAG: orotate phosphoribosyltransferase [Pseudomonadales bacterium]
MPNSDLARRIYQAAHLSGEFTLRSGVVSNEYFDKYQLESDPQLLRDITTEMATLVPPDTEILAGLEMGGIPVVTMLSQVTGLPCLFVRKQAKQYGTAKLAEGPAYEGKRVTIVEDVVTSGGQIVLSHRDLVLSGANCQQAICIIDREQGGREKLKAAGINLISLMTKSDLQAPSDSET